MNESVAPAVAFSLRVRNHGVAPVNVSLLLSLPLGLQNGTTRQPRGGHPLRFKTESALECKAACDANASCLSWSLETTGTLSTCENGFDGGRFITCPNCSGFYHARTSVGGGCTVLPPGPQCFVDGIGGRLLGSEPVTGVGGRATIGMTVKYCAQLCSDRNMSIAGVAFASQCMCGNEIHNKSQPGSCGAPSHSCTMPCSSNSSEICGGGNCIGIYHYKCEGAPEPAPLADMVWWQSCANELWPVRRNSDANCGFDIANRVHVVQTDVFNGYAARVKQEDFSCNVLPTNYSSLHGHNYTECWLNPDGVALSAYSNNSVSGVKGRWFVSNDGDLLHERAGVNISTAEQSGTFALVAPRSISSRKITGDHLADIWRQFTDDEINSVSASAVHGALIVETTAPTPVNTADFSLSHCLSFSLSLSLSLSLSSLRLALSVI